MLPICQFIDIFLFLINTICWDFSVEFAITISITFLLTLYVEFNHTFSDWLGIHRTKAKLLLFFWLHIIKVLFLSIILVCQNNYYLFKHFIQNFYFILNISQKHTPTKTTKFFLNFGLFIFRLFFWCCLVVCCFEFQTGTEVSNRFGWVYKAFLFHNKQQCYRKIK